MPKIVGADTRPHIWHNNDGTTGPNGETVYTEIVDDVGENLVVYLDHRTESGGDGSRERPFKRLKAAFAATEGLYCEYKVIGRGEDADDL